MKKLLIIAALFCLVSCSIHKKASQRAVYGKAWKKMKTCATYE